MVRMYVLTETETQIIQDYLTKGEKSASFYVLKQRLKDVNLADLAAQLEVIRQFKHQLILDKQEKHKK